MEFWLILFLEVFVICLACYRRKLVKAVYGIAALEIIMRLFAFISLNIGKNGLATALGKFPDSTLVLIDKFLDGVFYDILAWAFVIIIAYFLVETLRIFFKK
jgi:hypothetical protein